MPKGQVEHANLTVTDPQRSAVLFEKLCDWHERWRGPAMSGGETIHVGNETTYLALYTNPNATGGYRKGAPLNHIGLLIDDLDAAEKIAEEARRGRGIAATPFMHRGRRLQSFSIFPPYLPSSERVGRLRKPIRNRQPRDRGPLNECFWTEERPRCDGAWRASVVWRGTADEGRRNRQAGAGARRRPIPAPAHP